MIDVFAAAMARETHRFNEFVREDYIEHQDIGQGPGFKGLLQRFAWVYEAYPDFHVTEEITLCDGDKVAFFYTDRGTFAGPWQGIPPTGRKWDMQGIHIFRIQDGRIAEHWGVVDTFGLFLKMGILSQTAKQLEQQMGIA